MHDCHELRFKKKRYIIVTLVKSMFICTWKTPWKTQHWDRYQETETGSDEWTEPPGAHPRFAVRVNRQAVNNAVRDMQVSYDYSTVKYSRVQ